MIYKIAKSQELECWGSDKSENYDFIGYLTQNDLITIILHNNENDFCKIICKFGVCFIDFEIQCDLLHVT